MPAPDAPAAPSSATFESFSAELSRLVEREIDQLVYQLYALTPEEIALVEGTAPAPTPAVD